MKVLTQNIALSVDNLSPGAVSGALLIYIGCELLKEVISVKKILKEALEHFAKTCEFVYSNKLV